MHHVSTETEGLLEYPNTSFQNPIEKFLKSSLTRFDRYLHFSVFVHMVFLTLGVLEIVAVAVFFSFLMKSSYLAFGLASIFVTFFGYFIFRIYLQSAKPEKMEEIRDLFQESCKRSIHYQSGITEHHMALANACCRFSQELSGRESCYYRPPRWLDILKSKMEAFSEWWHKEDVYAMRELLLLASMEEHIKMVRCEPTSLEMHAALANVYVMLSTLYTNHLKSKRSSFLEKKFRQASERAIEEFKIISDYAPNDPWVHLQLAYSYRDLNMPLEEIQAYETILRINPTDKEALFKLGTLYFQQGMNAKGLQVYEELKRANFSKVENLIKYYGNASFG
jgi:tetratricopeptide (TPR) repeat protein